MKTIHYMCQGRKLETLHDALKWVAPERAVTMYIDNKPWKIIGRNADGSLWTQVVREVSHDPCAHGERKS